MRICVIGHFAGNLDEGFTNVSSKLVERLSPYHEIMKLDTKDVTSIHFLENIRKFNPEIVHQVAGPSFRAFLSLKFAKLQSNAKTIMSALHPESLRLSKVFFSKSVFSLLKPDLILVQSYESEKMFTDLGCETKFLPNGVDTKRFAPITQEEKLQLREKYGLPKEKFIILHVGHLIKPRGLQILGNVQKKDNQVVIVASTHKHKRKLIDQSLCHFLKERGCIIWDGYLRNIEEIYQLSDCYIFPVIKGYSLFMPLSVLEAMSCNLPVISTKFEGLTTFFKEGDGLMFIDKEEEIVRMVKEIKDGNVEIKTRESVLPYSWKNIGEELNNIYNKVISEAKI